MSLAEELIADFETDEVGDEDFDVKKEEDDLIEVKFLNHSVVYLK